MRPERSELRTVVALGEITVTGVLTGTGRRLQGSIAISGNADRLSCDQALELADALLLVVMRMDVVAEKRCRTITDATCEWEG